MRWLDRLLRVGSFSQSLTVYVPAVLVQRGLGLFRVVLLTYLLSKIEMGQWGLAVVIFTMGAPLVALGSNHGILRYVSYFETRGRLRRFWRQVWLWTPGLIVALTLLLGLSLQPTADAIEWVQKVLQVQPQSYRVLLFGRLSMVILANVAGLAMYINMLCFLYGLRAYRLASAVEVFFGILFTVSMLFMAPVGLTAMSLLQLHGFSLIVSLAGGLWLLKRLIRQLEIQPEPQEIQDDIHIEPPVEGDAATAEMPLPNIDEARLDETRGGWGQIIRYSLSTMVSAFVLQGAAYVSLLMIFFYYGAEYGGPFYVFMQFAQPVVFLASASWGVLFTHVAKRWELDDREGAMFLLETAFKTISLGVMTLTILLYATSPLWVKMLKSNYHFGLDYFNGLLTYFVMFSNLTMLTVLARLHERPSVISLAALSGAFLNTVLAAVWIPCWGEVGAARAAGVGMYFGGGLVMLVYLLASNTRLHDSTYFIMALPILLLLPGPFAAAIWLFLLPVCIYSPWMFDARQKKSLYHSTQRVIRKFTRRAE